jgi:hypothetical protein
MTRAAPAARVLHVRGRPAGLHRPRGGSFARGVRAAALIVALASAGPLAAQEPGAGDSLPAARPDSAGAADGVPAEGPADSLRIQRPDSIAADFAAPAPIDSAAIAPADTPAAVVDSVGAEADTGAAAPADAAARADSSAVLADSAGSRGDSLAAIPDSAARAAADSAAADTLEQVRGEIRSARERLEEVGRVLADLPADEEPRLSPRGAVLRAFALPGWGQFYTGHRLRGFLYAGAEVGFATLGFLKQRDVNEFKEEMQLARLGFVAEDQALHPDSAYSREDTLALYERFGTTPQGAALEATLEAKQRRREDFFTYSVFAVLFGAIDAFVSAHLDPYHEAEISASPVRGGGVRLDVTLPIGGGPGGPR